MILRVDKKDKLEYLQTLTSSGHSEVWDLAIDDLGSLWVMTSNPKNHLQVYIWSDEVSRVLLSTFINFCINMKLVPNRAISMLCVFFSGVDFAFSNCNLVDAINID